MNELKYYYLDDAKAPQGPFTLEELKQKFADREIYGHTFIAQKGAAQWNSLISVFPEFVQAPKGGIQRKNIDFQSGKKSTAVKSDEMPNHLLYDKGDYDFSMDVFATMRYCLKRLFTFSGRATRQEFWYYHIFVFFALFLPCVVTTIVIGVAFPDSDFALNVLVVYYFALFFLTPLLVLAVSFRRLHDLGHTGEWMYLSVFPPIGFLMLLYFLRDSQPGVNNYGLSLKYPDGPNKQS